MTKNPEIRFAKSIVDYIFRWMATKFLSPEAQFRAGVNIQEPASATTAPAGKPEAKKTESAVAGASAAAAPKGEVADSDVRRGGPSGPPKAQDFAHAAIQNQEDAPPCSTCGSIMIRSGSCYKCANCGTTSGCA